MYKRAPERGARKFYVSGVDSLFVGSDPASALVLNAKQSPAGRFCLDMERSDTVPLISVSRRAMACLFEVCFPADAAARQGVRRDCARLAIEALDLVETLEGQLSYFLPDSVLGRINESAAREPVEVEPWLFELLELAKRLCDETQGAYDITSAPLWEVWGFARREGKIPTEAQLAEARARVGCHMLELNPDSSTVRFLMPGMRINLGSVGKGYALDACCRRLEESGMTDFMVHGGQSSVLARGFIERCPAGEKQSGGRCWEVGITDPRRPGRRLGIVRLSDRSLATTSLQFQSFRHRGRRYGHVLDPRSGWPAERTIAATVVAPTAAMADALSTAFYVMGPRQSLEYVDSRSGLGAIVVSPGSGDSDIKIAKAGLGGDFAPCQ